MDVQAIPHIASIRLLETARSVLSVVEAVSTQHSMSLRGTACRSNLVANENSVRHAIATSPSAPRDDNFVVLSSASTSGWVGSPDSALINPA
jgi:hypothetical protein